MISDANQYHGNEITHREDWLCLQSKRWKNASMILIALIIALIVTPTSAVSGVYRYKDKDGKWVFTDTPSGENQQVTTVEQDAGDLRGLIDLEQILRKKFRPQTPIEEATLGTVTVKTKMGTGSGFFVTNSGHIITNKHVVRIDKKQYNIARDDIKQKDKRIEQIESEILKEQEKLREYKRRIDRDKIKYYRENLYLQKIRMKRDYEKQLAHYKELQKDFEKRKSDFYQIKRNYNSKKREFASKMSSANIARRFTIVLKDQVELDVRLVRVSQRHDLALLKLDGYKTPVLKLVAIGYAPQGSSVYAIGSPVGIRDSVAKGILSGYTNKYIKTDASIYPGNSGGPLVDDHGSVIGINTMKQITHKFEGLGFAIPIQTAIDAFQSDLPTSTAAVD